MGAELVSPRSNGSRHNKVGGLNFDENVGIFRCASPAENNRQAHHSRSLHGVDWKESVLDTN